MKKDVMSKTRGASRPQTKIENWGTKIAPIPGDLNARFVRCGKPNCKCAKGELHGPYYVRRFRSGGHRSSKYVKKGDVLTVKLAVETYRQEKKQSRREMREALRTIRTMRSRLFDLLSEYGL